MSNNGISSVESHLDHENTPLDEASYWALVHSAYEIATAEGFDATQFVDEQFNSYQELTVDSAEVTPAVERLLVRTAEVLGSAVTSTDYLPRVGDYEALKSSLQALPPAERCFCRFAVQTDANLSARLLEDSHFARPTHIDAQLIALLS